MMGLNHDSKLSILIYHHFNLYIYRECLDWLTNRSRAWNIIARLEIIMVTLSILNISGSKGGTK